MRDEVKVNIEDYIDLYNRSLKLSQIKPLKNQTYRLFKESGVDIRVAHRSQTYKSALDFKKIEFFMRDNEYFYMIPVTTIKGTIVGFILRGVLQSNYSTVSRKFSSYEEQVPLMFGFDKSFKNYDEQVEKYGKCLPIVVCEGSKDCLMLKKVYPYVVATNTSSLGVNALVLRNITDCFLLAYDNDKAGKDGISKDKKVLRNTGAFVESLKLHENVKDCADYLDKPEQFKQLVSQLKSKIRTLYNIGR